MSVECESGDADVRKHKVLHEEVQQLKQLTHTARPLQWYNAGIAIIKHITTVVQNNSQRLQLLKCSTVQ